MYDSGKKDDKSVIGNTRKYKCQETCDLEKGGGLSKPAACLSVLKSIKAHRAQKASKKLSKPP